MSSSYRTSNRYLRDLVLVAVLLGDVDMLRLRRGLVADVVVIELRVVHVKDVAVLVDDLVHEAAARSLGAIPVDDDRLPANASQYSSLMLNSRVAMERAKERAADTSREVSWTVHPKRSGLMISASHWPCASVSYAGALLIEVIGTVVESPAYDKRQ